MTDLPDIEDFWQWALQRWSQPGLAAALLPLQDQHGCVVLELLLLAWLDSRNLKLSPSGYDGLVDAAASWNAEVVLPLRAVRVGWRDNPDMAGQRERLQKLELAAERALAGLYFEFLGQLPATELSVSNMAESSSNLELAVQTAAPPLPQGQVVNLLELLSAQAVE